LILPAPSNKIFSGFKSLRTKFAFSGKKMNKGGWAPVNDAASVDVAERANDFSKDKGAIGQRQ